MMVYPEEPSIWSIPHIPALYDDDGDYGGKMKFNIAALIPPKLQQLHSRSACSPDEWIVALNSLICPRNSQSLTQLRAERKMKKSWSNDRSNQFGAVCADHSLFARRVQNIFHSVLCSLRWKCGNRRKKRNGREKRTKLNGGSEDWMDFGRRQMDSSDWLW